MVLCRSFLLVAFFAIQKANALVVGAGVLPHGDLALDPSLLAYLNQTVPLEAACYETGRILGALDIDVLFMTTPHSLANDIQFQIWRHSFLEGFTELGVFPPYVGNPPVTKADIKIPGHRELAERMVASLRATPAGQNVTGFLSNEDRYPGRLRWGEVTPLKFLEQPILQTARTVIMSLPARRVDQGFEMMPELLELGAEIFTYLHDIPERVLYMVSADLAHTHLAGAPYGFSPVAQPFDDDMGLFMETLDVSYLLRQGPNLQEAFADGYTGLGLLGGFLNSAPFSWDATLLINVHPTYYGMAAATYTPTAKHN